MAWSENTDFIALASMASPDTHFYYYTKNINLAFEVKDKETQKGIDL